MLLFRVFQRTNLSSVVVGAKFYKYPLRIAVVRSFWKKSQPNPEVLNEPVKYTTSKAGRWKAAYTSRGGEYKPRPKLERPAIIFSFVSILIYFCLLREENDLDEMLSMDSLTPNVPLNVEESILRQQMAAEYKVGILSQEKKRRLQEVIKAKKELQNKSLSDVKSDSS